MFLNSFNLKIFGEPLKSGTTVSILSIEKKKLVGRVFKDKNANGEKKKNNRK